MSIRKGAYPTMITPYRADGTVDMDTARQYVRWYAENGCDGIFAVCQSSEIFFLSTEETVALNRTVYEEVQAYNRTADKPMKVVSSGHVSYDLLKQADELCRVAESGTDALILITNRLDPYNEGDDVFIRNAETLIKQLPEDVPLGLYECPHPYKRLVTPRILRWCVETGRFTYMKDTCCDAAVIRERLRILQGTGFELYNANCQTLLQSMRDGGAGYCGIMCNFHPRLYSWLCHHYAEEPEKAEQLQALLGTFGFTEGGLPYPLTAKYHMNLEGIPTENLARNRHYSELTPYVKDCVEQMRRLTKAAEQTL